MDIFFGVNGRNFQHSQRGKQETFVKVMGTADVYRDSGATEYILMFGDTKFFLMIPVNDYKTNIFYTTLSKTEKIRFLDKVINYISHNNNNTLIERVNDLENKLKINEEFDNKIKTDLYYYIKDIESSTENLKHNFNFLVDELNRNNIENNLRKYTHEEFSDFSKILEWGDYIFRNKSKYYKIPIGISHN